MTPATSQNAKSDKPMIEDNFNYFRGISSIEDAQTGSCYQMLYFSPTGISVYQTQHKEHVEILIDVWNKFHELTGSNNKFLVQYIEPISIETPIPEMNMPPRPKDKSSDLSSITASKEDATKLGQFLDGDLPKAVPLIQ
jgi:hypothetical protein